MNLPAASCRASKYKLRVSAVIVDVRYFGDSLFDFKWAFKKLSKSSPEALKTHTHTHVQHVKTHTHTHKYNT